MSLHILSVSLIRCKNETLKKIAPQKHHKVLKTGKNMQVTINTILVSPHRLLC